MYKFALRKEVRYLESGQVNPLRWKIAWLPAEPGQDAIRWTVDRPDDYAFMAAVYDALYKGDRAFTSDAVRRFVRDRPDLAAYGGDRSV